MPDHGPIVLLTRHQMAAESFGNLLSDVCPEPHLQLTSPILEIEQLDVSMDLSTYEGLILTSPNAVPAAARLVQDMSPPVYCVGDGTAATARDAGLAAQSAQGDSAALISWITRRKVACPLLHLRGYISRGSIAEILTKQGIPTEELVVYRQNVLPLTEAARHALDGTSPVIAPVFSPRSAALLSEAVLHRAPALSVVAISDATANAWHAPARRLFIAEHPDKDSMAKAVCAAIKSDSPC